jgi:DUF1680 family protein
MYVTGGIGSSRQNEGFTEPYDLPNYDAYCETCASVGMVYWNARMNQLTGEGKYVDVLERSMYNGALAGVSLTGDRFFYVNPLASHGDHHRREWYGTACCPSQISRFLPSIGSYIYGTTDDALWVNLYVGSVTRVPVNGGEITLRQETSYPWDGEVILTVASLPKPMEKEVRLRIPAWCKSYGVAVNGEEINPVTMEKGYVVIPKQWKEGDEITLNMDMPVEMVASAPQVKENIGKRAVQRGPLVYCAEETDNNDFENLLLTKGTSFAPAFDKTVLGGVTVIDAVTDDRVIRLIPYYAWDNREAGEMKVWINYSDEQ